MKAGWTEVTFGEACSDVSSLAGKVPKSKWRNHGDLPVIDQGDSTVAGYTDDTALKFRGELPIIAFGDHTRRFKFVNDAFAVGADGVKILKPSNHFDPRFLYWFLASRDIPSAGYSRHFKFLKEARVPLPPLDEQRRIVRMLDRADQLRSARRASLGAVSELRIALFDDAFGGSHQAPVTVGERLATHPRGWHWELLGDVAELATGHTPDRKKPEYWNGDVPWITLTDIRALDGRTAEYTSESITEAGLANSSAVKLPSRTVCFSRTASLGFVTIIGRPMATSQDFVNWICGDRLNPTYLMYALIRSRARLRGLSTGSTHKTIYFPTVQRFRVLVPPLVEQERFAARVAVAEAVCDRAAEHLAELDRLFVSVQHRAFIGAL